MASVHQLPFDFESLHGVCRPPSNGNFSHNRDIIDNRDYNIMDTIIVMLENPQSLSPT